MKNLILLLLFAACNNDHNPTIIVDPPPTQIYTPDSIKDSILTKDNLPGILDTPEVNLY